jgi:hypothetical protein
MNPNNILPFNNNNNNNTIERYLNNNKTLNVLNYKQTSKLSCSYIVHQVNYEHRLTKKKENS